MTSAATTPARHTTFTAASWRRVAQQLLKEEARLRSSGVWIDDITAQNVANLRTELEVLFRANPPNQKDGALLP